MWEEVRDKMRAGEKRKERTKGKRRCGGKERGKKGETG